MMSDGRAPILREKKSKFVLTRKWRTPVLKDFYLSTSSTRSQNNQFLRPEKWNKKGRTAVYPEGTDNKEKQLTKTKKLVTRKTYVNELHENLVHTKEDMLHTTAKHL